MERRWVTQSTPRGVIVACVVRPGWVAVGTFVKRGAQLHLADLAIAAGEIPPDHQPDPTTGIAVFRGDTIGGWLLERRYLEVDRQDAALGSTPEPHSIQARLIREVPIAEMSQQAAASLPEFVAFGELLRKGGAPEREWQYLVSLEPDETELSPERLDYLRAAVTWAARPLNFDDPRRAVRNDLGLTEQQLQERLRHARRLGYLTSPGRGRRGGELTPLGAALASHHFSQED